METGLSRKIVIITGGGSGLGRAVAEAFASEGAYPFITYLSRKDPALKLSLRLADQYKVKSGAFYCDITQPDSIDKLLQNISENYGTPDILVNNAATWPTAFVSEMEDSDWDKTIKLNLSGYFYFSKRFINLLLSSEKKGRVVNIVSFAGFIGSTTGHAHYAAAKGGVITFTKSLAREAAGKGITVNAVSPGMMRTPMSEEPLAKNKEAYLKRIPMGRIAEPEEVAPAVVFLSSDKAGYITGATLDVSGGLLMH